jgi:hypothetical protein
MVWDTFTALSIKDAFWDFVHCTKSQKATLIALVDVYFIVRFTIVADLSKP